MKILNKDLIQEQFDEIPIVGEITMIQLTAMFKEDHEGTLKKLNATSIKHIINSHEKLRYLLNEKLGVKKF